MSTYRCYVRMTGDVVSEVLAVPDGTSITDCLHPSLVSQYQLVPNGGIMPGATYDATTGTYTNPDASAVAAPEADEAARLAAAQATKRVEINTAAQTALSALASGYPDWEVSTWDQQLREAQLVAADASLANDLAEGQVDTIPLIRHMATVRTSLGETAGARIITLAGRIRANAAAWSVEAGKIIGQRQALEDAVVAAGSPADVTAVVVEFGVV